MKIENLYEFMVLAHYNSFTAAANNLHISQPTLSKHISEIEREVGVDLFQRDKQLKLTPAGSSFLEDAIQIHHLYKNALVKAQDTSRRDSGNLIIQQPYIVDAMSEILYKSAAAFKFANPSVAVKYFNKKGEKSLEALQSKDIDIALTVDSKSGEEMDKIGERKGVIFYPVIKEPLFLRLQSSHPLATKPRITLDDLLTIPISMTAERCYDPMRFAILDLFQNALHAKPELRPRHFNNLEEFFLSSYNEEMAFIVTPVVASSELMNMQYGMVSRPIEDDQAYLTSYLVFRNDYQNHQIDAFLDVLEQVVHDDIVHNDKAFYLADAR